jgi:hypothetical protein
MRPFRLALALAVLTAVPALAAEGKLAYHVGDAVPEIAAKDVDGADWTLAAARDISDAKALEAVRKAATDYGGKADAKAEDALDGLAGLQGADGSPDLALRKEFARKVGKPYGLFPTDALVQGWRTFGDVAGWVKGCATAPIVLMWWSPKCPTSAKYEERIEEVLGETKARIFPVATNFQDDDESIRAYLQAKGIPYRVLIDREATLADRFGAKRTPHVFVLDEKNHLRYSGQVDDDGDEGARANWLLDALKAVVDGQQPNVLMTEPKG